MNYLNLLFNQATHRISNIMLPGAYAKLKEKAPKRLEKVELDLEVNFTEEGIEKYEAAIIRGIKKVQND